MHCNNWHSSDLAWEQGISALSEAAEPVWDWLRRLAAMALAMVRDWCTAIVVALAVTDALKLIATWAVVFSNPVPH
jgi:hypothetical protein